jgi:hypothetical protein
MTSHWNRWTTTYKIFPKDKYQFTKLLVKRGDFVVTPPLDNKERKKFKDAAYAWAWRKGYTVEITSTPVADALWEVKCQLVAKTKLREFV